MRTSLNDIATIESYLTGKLTIEESLFFEARLLTDRDLEEHTRLQKIIHQLVKWFGRKQLKKELESIHTRLLIHPDKGSYQREITEIFNKN